MENAADATAEGMTNSFISLSHHPLLSQRDVIYFICHDLYTYRVVMSKRKNHRQWKPLIRFQKIRSDKKLHLYNKHTNFKIYSG